jgi:hypothetical protein
MLALSRYVPFFCHLPVQQWHVPPQHHHWVDVGTQWVKATFKWYDYGWKTCGRQGEKEVFHSRCLLKPTDVFAEASKLYWRPFPA